MEKVPSPTIDRPTHRQLTIICHCLAIASLLLAVGCEFTPPGPPERFPVAVVHGRITAAGKAVSAGWITLMPVDGAVGDSTVGRIRPTGEYCFENAPVGPLQVRLRIPPAAHPEVLRNDGFFQRKLSLLQGNASPVRITTTGTSELVFDFDLVTSPIK